MSLATKRYLQAHVSQLERELAETVKERDRYREERDRLCAEMPKGENHDLRAQLAASQEKLGREKEQLLEEVADLRRELEQLRAELEQYRAVEKARKEARLGVEKLELEVAELRKQLTEQRELPVDSTSSNSRETSSTGAGDNTALLAQQLQLIEKFSGAHTDEQNDSFKEWLEQFETVANTFGWSDRVKQMGLMTRLKGPALDFYRVCLPEKRDTYEKLKACLTSHFVPVRLQAVQSYLFSERRQKSGETVNSYAQDLRDCLSWHILTQPEMTRQKGG